MIFKLFFFNFFIILNSFLRVIYTCKHFCDLCIRAKFYFSNTSKILLLSQNSIHTNKIIFNLFMHLICYLYLMGVNINLPHYLVFLSFKFIVPFLCLGSYGQCLQPLPQHWPRSIWKRAVKTTLSPSK